MLTKILAGLVEPSEGRVLYNGQALADLSFEEFNPMRSSTAFAFENGGHETGLICLKGTGNVTAGGQTFAMRRYDALYVPRDSNISVASDGAV